MRKLKGLEVANSVRGLKITITEDDIKRGRILDPANCAVAQALKRAFDVEDVRVHRGVTYILRKGAKKWQKFRTSSNVRLETIIFDRGGAFIPGEYDLGAPPVSMIVGSTLRKKRTPTKGKTPSEAKKSARRLVIPGVRHSANSRGPEEEK